MTAFKWKAFQISRDLKSERCPVSKEGPLKASDYTRQENILKNAREGQNKRYPHGASKPKRIQQDRKIMTAAGSEPEPPQRLEVKIYKEF